ncbi:MAG TPA: hypothetical protein VE172_02815 [Stackebrandtia sp.]|jgi:hypothetical protein|uniref:hypothetical protein n=1 Tax=Stackebrandtia sp. TaxID=2023065 RepID=UPI002D5E9044|nr:hypothetical protein [Stackebrandtia sp.]HZE37719.1 hypothetical protein [Stackebrandtia sp.]
MNRHVTDTLSLVAGLVFVTFGGVWLLDDVVTLSTDAIAMIFAGVFLLAGLVGLVRAMRRPRSDDSAEVERR